MPPSAWRCADQQLHCRHAVGPDTYLSPQDWGPALRLTLDLLRSPRLAAGPPRPQAAGVRGPSPSHRPNSPSTASPAPALT